MLLPFSNYPGLAAFMGRPVKTLPKAFFSMPAGPDILKIYSFIKRLSGFSNIEWQKFKHAFRVVKKLNARH